MTRLKEMLKHVGLHNISRQEFDLDISNLNNLDYLEYIITQEIRMRDKKNINKRQKASMLSDKLLKDFNCNEIEGITQWQLDKFIQMQFVDSFTNILITGSQGLGKTHIANGIGNVAVVKGVKTYYITLANLLLALKSEEKKHKKALEYIQECQLVIIDEFLYTPLNEQEGQMMYHYFTDLNRAKSLVIISNKTINEQYERFTDKLLGATLIDRLTEESIIINLSGVSYRQKKLAK